MISKDIFLEIDGIGIVLYSNKAMLNIAEGDNFFNKEFASPQNVSEHIKKGDIIGVNTGSSGSYNLHIRQGYPSEEMIRDYPIGVRLALNVIGDRVSFIDLYWLMEWSKNVPKEQTIEIEEGIYHISIVTRKPVSGVLGDNQDIYIYFEKIDKMPELTWDGVPLLF